MQDNIGRLSKCAEGERDMQACALADFDRLQQLVKGMYSLFLPSWLASYPPSHLLVLNFDDYRCVLSCQRDVCWTTLASLSYDV